jgi:hypothetical protein
MSAIENKTDDPIFVRQKIGVSVDECARLCLFEPAFTCSLMSYSEIFLDCKWSSLPLPNTASHADFVIIREKYSLFVRDPLYDFIEYPFKVTSVYDYVSVTVSSKAECAYACNDQKSIRCRSFNLCKDTDTTFKCLMSETNLYSTDRDPNLVDVGSCSHFSSKDYTFNIF